MELCSVDYPEEDNQKLKPSSLEGTDFIRPFFYSPKECRFFAISFERGRKRA